MRLELLLAFMLIVHRDDHTYTIDHPVVRRGDETPIRKCHAAGGAGFTSSGLGASRRDSRVGQSFSIRATSHTTLEVLVIHQGWHPTRLSHLRRLLSSWRFEVQ
jgi:hypothetical protein